MTVALGQPGFMSEWHFQHDKSVSWSHTTRPQMGSIIYGDPNLHTHSVKAHELATDTMSIKYDQTYISPAQYLLARAAINVIHSV